MARVDESRLAEKFRKIRAQLLTATNAEQMKFLGKTAVELIVKRTRLGFGVNESYGARSPLKRLSPNYIKVRQGFSQLSETTTPRKSNLTFTGDMLQSVDVVRATRGTVIIGPSGKSREGVSHRKITEYQVAQGRIYLNISQNEFSQILSSYRKRFGDLLKLSALLR